MTLFMHSMTSAWYWDRNRPTRDGLLFLRDIGFTALRYGIDVSQLCKSPYKYDWEIRLDKDMQLFDELRFAVMINPQWAPKHFSGGQPAYAEGVWGCWVKDKQAKNGWRLALNCGWLEGGVPHEAGTDTVPGACGRPKEDDRHRFFSAGIPDTMEGHTFTPEKPYCVHPNIPHLDPVQEEHFAAALAERYGSITNAGKRLVQWWSRSNEPDGAAFFIPMSEPPWEAQYDRLVTEQWAPFIRGVRSVLSDAVIVGPDAASPGGIHYFVEALARVGLRVDEISGHMYPTGRPFPEGTIDEITRPNGWLDVMRKHGYARIWNTEFTDASGDGSMSSNGKLAVGLREIIARFPEIVTHCHHDESLLVVGGREAWDAGRFGPSQTAIEMKALIAEVNGEIAPPPPPVRVLTEPAYRIVNMKRYVTRDRVYIAPTYLFVAVHVPMPIVTRGQALNVSVPVWLDDYMIVPVMNDAFVRGDQQFTVHLDESNGPPWFGPAKWSELPEARKVEFGFDDDSGKRRRRVRS